MNLKRIKDEVLPEEVALQGGKSYCNFEYSPKEYFSAPDKLFENFALKNREGVVVKKSEGDASPGWDYASHGAMYPIAHNYSVETAAGDKKEFDICSVTNEGYDPNGKGWSEKGGKKVFTGSSYGWFLNGVKMSWREIQTRVSQELF